MQNVHGDSRKPEHQDFLDSAHPLLLRALFRGEDMIYLFLFLSGLLAATPDAISDRQFRGRDLSGDRGEICLGTKYMYSIGYSTQNTRCAHYSLPLNTKQKKQFVSYHEDTMNADDQCLAVFHIKRGRSYPDRILLLDKRAST